MLIAGQAPGLRVHESGLPFDDASGDRLRQWLHVDRPTFYDRDRFAIVPMGLCFPGYDANGSDLPPRRECAPVWQDRVLSVMPQIELVLAVGGHAQAWHMGAMRRENMTETVRAWRNSLESDRQPALLPLPHPSWRNTAWLKRNPWFEEELLPELRRRIKMLTC
ncbi:uracil-DNA glycosylase [Rhizobium sp. BK650]|nr:uracil-DNA glycosylase [Rhizobium sp. BK650]